MDQPTFSDLEYQGKKRKTRRDLFLERMDSLIPWQRLEERILPFYPKAGNGRHRAFYPLHRHVESPLRPALGYNLSDPGMEERALRGRVGQAVCGSEDCRMPCLTRQPS